MENYDIKKFENFFLKWESENFFFYSNFYKISSILFASLILKFILLIFLKMDPINNKLDSFSLLPFVLDIIVLFSLLLIFIVTILMPEFRELLIKKIIFQIFPNINIRKYIQSFILKHEIQSESQILEIIEKIDVTSKRKFSVAILFLKGLLVLDCFQYILLIQLIFT